MPTINTPLYGKDNLDGHSSNVCIDNRFFLWRNPFLSRELDYKQTIDNLLKIISYMHTNSKQIWWKYPQKYECAAYPD